MAMEVKKSQKTSTKSTKKSTVEKPPPIEKAPVVEEPTEKPTEEPIVEVVEEKSKTKQSSSEKMMEVLEKLNAMKKEISTIIDEVKKLAKDKKKTRNTNVKSGFSKQVELSPKLSGFLNLPPEQLMSRVDVTRLVTEYIKNNDLQIVENKQHFRVDNKLSDLFDITEGSQLHYFKLQSHLKYHYPKTQTIV